MSRTPKYQKYDLVRAVSVTGKTIIGKYMGNRPNSFGVIIFGHEEDTTNPPKEHICTSLTLHAIDPKHPMRVHVRHRIKCIPGIKHGDMVRADTKKGKNVIGYLQKLAGDFAYVRGWEIGASKQLPKQSFRVRRSTVRKVPESDLTLTSSPLWRQS